MSSIYLSTNLVIHSDTKDSNNAELSVTWILVTMLETLPAHDILYPLILSRLAPSDLFTLRTSSSSLNRLVTVYITLSRSLDLGYNKRANQTAFHILTRDAVSLRDLNLSGLKFLTDDLLRPVLLQNPHLTSLELSECHHLTSGILHTLSSRFLTNNKLDPERILNSGNLILTGVINWRD